ncbi:hypothetical protein BC828DRAFT_376096 [Blastocladiella britannica]|nr:hypothetical protein BC828DRAFT_376096 [Blastocladiella britannica]
MANFSFGDKATRVLDRRVAFGAPLIRILNFVFLVAVFAINGLSTGTAFNGKSNKILSDMLPNYLVPSGWAFSIWGVIYLFMAAWGIYQLLPRSYDDPACNEGVGYVFLLNAVFNITWILVFAYRLLPLSVMAILGVAVTNIVVWYRLKSKNSDPTWTQYICVHVGFSFYTAWLIGASLVNLFAVSTTRDPSLIPQAIAALVFLGVVEIVMALWAMDPIIPGVGTWTLIANYAVNSDVPQLNTAVIALAAILGAVTALVWVWRIVAIFKGRGWHSAV